MKKSLLYFILFICAPNIYAQGIIYQKSYNDALAQAAKSNKPIFILLNTPADSAHSYVNNMNSFNTKPVADFYNKKFISYKAALTDSGAAKIRAAVKPTAFPAYIFLDTKGQIIYKTAGNYYEPEKYVNIAKNALNRLASGKTIGTYEQLNKEGKITRDQLKEYITLKQELQDNAELIDKYVGFLTINELNDYNQVLFILKAGPYAYGKAFSLIYVDRKMADSIYKHEPLELRKTINNRIITNTRNQAIKTKSNLMAQNLAGFTRTTWGTNYKEANRTAANEMVYYYRSIKDTASYFRDASYYYDQYYLNISADSARKLNAKALDNMQESMKVNSPKPVVTTKNAEASTTAFSRIILAQPFNVANALNNAAFDFYAFGTHNMNYLIKAMLWSRRAIELNPMPGYYDTLAHIMYRMNLYAEAESNQEKAIEIASTESKYKNLVARYKLELNKMKDRKL